MQTSLERTDWVQLFFNAAGRIGRIEFALGIAVVIAVFALYEWSVTGLAHDLTGWLAHLILLAAGGTVLSKRFHDRGRSGWRSAPVILAFIIVWPGPSGVIDFLVSLLLVWAAVELGLLPGDEGLNRYGPPA